MRTLFRRIVSVIVALCVSMMLAGTAPALAVPPFAASFAPASVAAAADTSWTISYTGVGTLAHACQIVVQAPGGTSFSADSGDYTVSASGGGDATVSSVELSPDGSTVTIILGSPTAVAAGDTVTVTALNVTNPPAGTYDASEFMVGTTVDQVPVNPESGLTFAASPSAVQFSVDSDRGAQATTWYVDFTATSPVGTGASGGSITIVAPAGTVFSDDPSVYTLGSGPSSGSASSVSVSAADGSATNNQVTIVPGDGEIWSPFGSIDSPFTISPGSAATVAVAGVTNPPAGAYASGAFSVATSGDTTPANPDSGMTFLASPSSVSVTPTTVTAGATSQWDWSFRTASGPLGAGDTITLTGPAAATFSGTSSDYSIQVDGSAAPAPAEVSVTGSQVVITLGASTSIGAGDTVTVKMDNVTNPGSGTCLSSDLSAATSLDTIAASPDSGLTFAPSPTNVSFTPAITMAGAMSDWTVEFTTGAALPDGSQITLRGPSGMLWGDNRDLTVDNGHSAIISSYSSGDGVFWFTISSSTIAASDTVTVVFHGVTNPLADGAYPATAFSVATSAETAPAHPASGVTLTPAAMPTDVSFQAASNEAGACNTWTVAFTTSVNGGPLGAGGTITVVGPGTFSTAPGDYSISADHGHTATVGSVAVSTSGSLHLAVITLDSSTIDVGDTVTVSAANTTNFVNAGAWTAASFSAATSVDIVAGHPNTGVTFIVPPTGVSFAAAQTAEGASTDWTVDFTASTHSGTLTPDSTITLTGPAGTTFSSDRADYTVRDVTYGEDATLASVTVSATGGSATNNRAVIVLGNSQTWNPDFFQYISWYIYPGDVLTVTAANTTNPVAGAYDPSDFAVSTSQNLLPGHPGTGVTFLRKATGVSFSPASVVPGLSSTWTVRFTTNAGGGPLGAGGTITLNAPEGTALPETAGDYSISVNNGHAATVGSVAASATGGSATNNRVVITLAASTIAAGDTVTVAAANTVNPNNSGALDADSFSVSTSVDPGPASPTNGVILGFSPIGISFTPDSTRPGASATWTVGFTTNGGGALGGGGTITLTAPSGTAFPGAAGNYSISVSNGHVATVASVTASTTGGSATANRVVITLGASTIAAGDTVTLAAAGVVNPPGGTYAGATFSLATSSDTISAASAGPVTFRVPDAPSSSGSTPAYTATITGGSELSVDVDADAANASVDLTTVTGNALGSGVSEVVTLPSVPGVNSYTANIPAIAISDSEGTSQITISTDVGSLTIPGNMLAGLDLSGEAGITIGKGDKTNLTAEVRGAIGDRPVIQLTFTVGGSQTEWNNPDAPVTVSVPYTPTAGELANPESIVIWYIDGNGVLVPVPTGRYDAATGMVTFSATHFSDYAVGYNKVGFSDVAHDAWYAGAVSFIAARTITEGTGNGNYSPEAGLTRGDFLVLVMKAYGIAPEGNSQDNFADAGNTYYTGYLAAVKRLGIASGVGDNMFAPARQISRQEMFTLLYKALNLIGRLPQYDSGKTLASFGDAGQIKPWAAEAMTYLVKAGTVSGCGGKLFPADTVTRAELAQVLYNLLSK